MFTHPQMGKLRSQLIPPETVWHGWGPGTGAAGRAPEGPRVSAGARPALPPSGHGPLGPPPAHLSNGGDCAHVIEFMEDEMSVLRCPRGAQ